MLTLWYSAVNDRLLSLDVVVQAPQSEQYSGALVSHSPLHVMCLCALFICLLWVTLSEDIFMMMIHGCTLAISAFFNVCEKQNSAGQRRDDKEMHRCCSAPFTRRDQKQDSTSVFRMLQQNFKREWRERGLRLPCFSASSLVVCLS